MNDVVVPLHADGCDGEDRGGDEEYIEEDVDLALQHSERHVSEVRRAGHDPKRHEQDGAQQVHRAQVAHKGKFPEMRRFYDNDQNSSVGQKCQNIQGHHEKYPCQVLEACLRVGKSAQLSAGSGG